MPENRPALLQPRVLLLATLLLLLIIRVGFLLVFQQTLNFDLPGNEIHGSVAYDEYALNLLSTGVYGREAGIPDAGIPPLFSYVLAAVYTVFGRGYMQVGLFNTALDMISVVLLYDICRRLFTRQKLWGQSIGEWTGILAGVFFVLYPYLTFQNLTLIDTSFWILFLHLFTWLLILLREQAIINRKTIFLMIAAGVVLGLSLLARPQLPFFAILVALWFLFRHSLWQSLLRLIPVAMIGAITLLPWIIRNYEVYDKFVPLAQNGGSNLWQGNSEWVIPVFRAGYDVQWTKPLQIPEQNCLDDAKCSALAVQFWQENPEKIPELLWVKFLVHWSIPITPLYNPQPGESFALDENGNFYIEEGETTAGVTASNASYNQGGLLDTVGRPVHIIYFGSLLLLAIIGVIVSFGQWHDVSLLWFVQISMTVVYLIFHPSTRYRSPSDPLLFALSAYALLWILMRFIQNRRAHQTDAST